MDRTRISPIMTPLFEIDANPVDPAVWVMEPTAVKFGPLTLV
jgi:hypothetical protein